MEKQSIEHRIDVLESRADHGKKRDIEKISQLIHQINSAFESHAKHIAKQFDKTSTYIAKRFDDMDYRLSKIEADMEIVRKELSNVSNWTKTSDHMFQLTRTHAYEIPKIEVRLDKLEKVNTTDSDSYSESK
ncbi:MAG: hypothetical protein K8823_1223 [Cenarchaeum symbiont of Oopsacas minuta]|nr:hypothetical protein [Cenarchaeum symbiont of Oopsacas minuta]